MGRLNNDEQFKFLISCIRWSNNGKVDFTEVAEECGIVSKGAAAKRYERMMKAHGIYQPTNTSRDTAVPPMRKQGKDGDNEPASKKRKMDAFDKENVKGPTRKKTKKVKHESSDTEVANETPIKEEQGATYGCPWPAYSTPPEAGNQDHAVFDEFLAGSSFQPINAATSEHTVPKEHHYGYEQQELAASGTGEVKHPVD